MKFNIASLFFPCISVALASCYSSSDRLSRRDEDLRFLSYAHEHAEAIEDVVSSLQKTERNKSVYGFSHFETIYKDLPNKDKIWYAILYGAEHQLDGEYAARFDFLIASERSEVRKVVRRFAEDEFTLIGKLFCLEPIIVKRRLWRIADLPISEL